MYLNVRAHTPIGTFSGTVNKLPGTKQQVEKLKEQLVSSKLSFLVLLTKNEEGEYVETALFENVIQNSVLHFVVQETGFKFD